MWDELSLEFKILLVASEIVITILVFIVLFKAFNRFKKDENKQKDDIEKWKDN
jgi:hypothetical protein